jgi:hypothetical protein
MVDKVGAEFGTEALGRRKLFYKPNGLVAGVQRRCYSLVPGKLKIIA